jgi:hypothetical protein
MWCKKHFDTSDRQTYLLTNGRKLCIQCYEEFLIAHVTELTEHPPEPALKPCPFCGAVPWPRSDDGGTLIYCANISGCKVATRVHLPDKDEAIAAWNRRA